MVVIEKHENERCKREEPEFSQSKYIYLLRRADGKYFYEDVSKIMDTLKQDKYEIIHDHIAELFYAQIRCDEAYTSSSSLAGHHNTDMDGTLIFNRGEPFYVCDEPIELLFDECLEPWD